MVISKKRTRKVVNEAISCVEKLEVVILDDSPMAKSGNHEPPTLGVGFSCDPDPEPIVGFGVNVVPFVVPVVIGVEFAEDFWLQENKYTYFFF